MAFFTNKLAAFLVFLAIVFAAGVGVYLHRPPDPRPENAPPDQFSAVRAHRHLEAYAKEPHRAGTDANYAVRDYIVNTLESMGADPQVTESATVHRKIAKRATGALDGFMEDDRKERSAKIVMASPQNILARIPGSDPTKAFLFMAHYDSVPFGPGASDDGSGVASMLEMYRSLKGGPPLKNDVIFLFTDGEECGLWGPRSFLDHEWCKDTGLLLNFEARGNHGPSNLFETSLDNGWLIQEIAKAAPYPIMSSMMFDFYNRTPFATDYDVLKKTIPGMNVAWIGGFSYYHTANDNSRNISLASLQHHGSYAESLVRHFGNMPLDNVPKAPDAVYFNTLGSHLVHYAPFWAQVFAVVIAVFFFAVLVLGIVKKRFSIGGILCGTLLLIVTALGALLANGAMLGVALLIRGLAVAYDTGFYYMAFVLLTFAVVTRLHRKYRQRISMENLAAGAMLWWTLMMIQSSFVRPNVSYLSTWPLLIGTATLGILLLLPEKSRGTVRIGVLAVSGVCIALFFAPLIYISAIMLIALGGPLIMILVVFMFGLLVPHVEAIAPPNSRWIPRASAILGLAFLQKTRRMDRAVFPAGRGPRRHSRVRIRT